MPGIKVSVRRLIKVPSDFVADFVTNPDNAPVWHSRVAAVEWQSQRPATIGSRLTYIANVFNRKITYPIEIVEFLPHERLTLRATQKRFPMEITYAWKQTDDGCEVTLTNTGTPSGLSRFNAELIRRALRQQASKDLGNLARLTEGFFRHIDP